MQDHAHNAPIMRSLLVMAFLALFVAMTAVIAPEVRWRHQLAACSERHGVLVRPRTAALSPVCIGALPVL